MPRFTLYVHYLSKIEYHPKIRTLTFAASCGMSRTHWLRFMSEVKIVYLIICPVHTEHATHIVVGDWEVATHFWFSYAYIKVKNCYQYQRHVQQGPSFFFIISTVSKAADDKCISCSTKERRYSFSLLATWFSAVVNGRISICYVEPLCALLCFNISLCPQI